MKLLGFRSESAQVFSGWNGPSRTHSRIRAILLLLLMGNVFLLAQLLRPPGRTLAARQERFERARSQQEAARNTVQQLRERRAKLEAALHNGEGFIRQNFLPRDRAFSIMLADLEQMASKNRLQPSGINYRLKEEDSQPGWTNVETNLTVEGEYPDLVQFINLLEQSQLFWLIDSLSVSGTSGRGLRLDLQMRTYLMPSVGNVG